MFKRDVFLGGVYYSKEDAHANVLFPIKDLHKLKFWGFPLGMKFTTSNLEIFFGSFGMVVKATVTNGGCGFVLFLNLEARESCIRLAVADRLIYPPGIRVQARRA